MWGAMLQLMKAYVVLLSLLWNEQFVSVIR